MKFFLKLVVLVFLLFSCKDEIVSHVDKAQHVVVIGVDAFSPDALQKAKTPTVNLLIQNGAASMHARGVFPTKSGPNWASMILGAGPEQHGITSNNWELVRANIASTEADSQGYFPSIFTTLREQKGTDFKMGVFHHWKKFSKLFNNNYVNVVKHGKTVEETVHFATEYIKKDKPNFTFIHLDELDHVGHDYGHGTAKYYKEAEAIDASIGSIVTALKEAGIFEESIIIVTADHGGLGKDHGEETMDELEIPWVISGAGIIKNKCLNTHINTYDTAATVAYIFGCKQPDAWIAKPVLEAFLNTTTQESNPKQYVAKPLISPYNNKYIYNETKVSINSDTPKAEIRFTLDGTEPTKSSTLYNNDLNIANTVFIRAKAFVGNSQSDETNISLNYIDNSIEKNVKYNYYEADILDWEEVEALTPTKQGNLYGLDLNQIPHRDKNYVVKYTTKLNVATADIYRFSTISYGWSYLKIDDKVVIDEKYHHMSSRLGFTTLEKGEHKLEFIYYSHKPKKQPFELYYAGSDFILQKIPVTEFKP